jgi:hypothetical protein
MRELTAKEAELLAAKTRKESETPGQRELRRRLERDRAGQFACQLGGGVIMLGLAAGIMAVFSSNWGPAAAAFGLLQFGILLLIPTKYAKYTK